MLRKVNLIIVSLIMMIISINKVNALEITSQYDTDDLVNYNKIYIPDSYINQNYNYTYNGNDIVIITNNNCYQNYNTTYCNCYTYNIENNIISEVYSCSTTTNNTRIINKNYISNNIRYSNRLIDMFFKDKIIKLIMIGVAIIFGIFVTRERKCL